MFAHQVIDDFNDYLVRAKRLNEEHSKAYITAIQIVINSMIKSHQFHIGEQEEFYDSMGVEKQIKNKKRIFMEDSEGLRLPYPICWFDAKRSSDGPLGEDQNGLVKSPKRGCIAIEINPKILSLFVIQYMGDIKHWYLTPFQYYIHIGSSWGDADIFQSYIHKYHLKTLNGNILIQPLFASEYFKPGTRDQKIREDADEITMVEMMMKLLSCKNITTETHDPPAKLNKARQKRGKQPLFTYHTLVLKPVGKKQESIPKHLWNNRIHLQRGHFKTYTQESPLFGSITGRFWWQPHVRGQNREGVVMKDYKVEAS